MGNWWLPLSQIEDTTAFPAGVRDLFQHARRHITPDGKPMRAVLWTEPERVSRGSYIDQHYPHLLFQPDAPELGNQLMDLGNPEAKRYIVEWVSAAIKKVSHLLQALRRVVCMNVSIHQI